jgi:hypothetical protein
MDSKREFLCHMLASVAYHLQKSLRGAPSGFASFRVAPKSRTPQELVRHIDGVLGYSRTCFVGGTYRNELLESMDAQVRQVHATIEAVAECLRHEPLMAGFREEQLLQGPFSDALTHIGQISYLRRLFGSPVASEDFIYARISADNLGPDQPAPERPDADWQP